MKFPSLSSPLIAFAAFFACPGWGMAAEGEGSTFMFTPTAATNAPGAPSSGGMSVTLQTPTYEYTVPSSLQTLTGAGEVTTVAPWFPATFVLHNGSSKDIELNWHAGPRVTFTLYNSEGVKIWTDAPSLDAEPAPVAGRIVRGSQLRETGKIPLTDQGAPLPPGSYSLVGTLNADKVFSTQTCINVETMQVPRVDTGVSGLVVRVNGDGSTTGVKATLQLMEVLPPGSTEPPNGHSGVADENGRFRLAGVFAGTYRLSVTATSSTPGQGASDTITATVVDGQILDVGTLRLTQVPLAGTGAIGRVEKVIEAGGETASLGASAMLSFVEVVPEGIHRGAYSRSGRADASGQFKVGGLFPGTYRVTAIPFAGTPGLAASDTQTVMVEVGHFIDIGVLKLRTVELPATGVDGLVVALDSTGKEIPVLGATVQLRETDAPPTRDANRYTGISGPEGRFVLGLIPGSYAITITKAMPASGTAPAITHLGTGSITVMPNARASTRIKLEKPVN